MTPEQEIKAIHVRYKDLTHRFRVVVEETCTYERMQQLKELQKKGDVKIYKIFLGETDRKKIVEYLNQRRQKSIEKGKI